MRKYILKRLGISLIILFFVALIIYSIMRCMPSSYVESLARQMSQKPGAKSYQEWLDQLNKAYGLDVGIIPGYIHWLGQAVRGNFGDSWYWNVPVLT